MRTRQEREAFLGSAVSAVAGRIGFVDSAAFSDVWNPNSRSWFFHRSDLGFRTALLGFELFSRPERLLSVEMLGSPHSIESLRETGLEMKAVAFNLNQFQVDQLDRDPTKVLPPDIPMNPATRDHWEDVLERVSAELLSIHPLIWEEIEQRWLPRLTPQS